MIAKIFITGCISIGLDYFNITNKYNKASIVTDVFISILIDIIDLFVFNLSNISAPLISGLLPINKKYRLTFIEVDVDTIVCIYDFHTYGVWLSPPRFTFQSFEQRALKRISTTIANSKPFYIVSLFAYGRLYFYL